MRKGGCELPGGAFSGKDAIPSRESLPASGFTLVVLLCFSCHKYEHYRELIKGFG